MRKWVLLFLLQCVIFSAFPQQKVNLLEEAEKLGAVVYWDSLSGTGLIEKDGHQISFRAGDSFVLHDFKNLALTDSPVVKDGIVYVSKQFLEDASLFVQEEEESGYRVGAILIDPGHGGKDPGAQETHVINGKKVTVTEKEINLIVGKMLYSRLKSAYPNKKIIMTRDSDVFLSLSERTEIANSVKLGEKEAILYISIHVNSSLDKKAAGYEAWYLSPGYRRSVLEKTEGVDKNLFNVLNIMLDEEYMTESILIAKFIMDGIQAQVGNAAIRRDIKAEEWFVIRNSNMPAVLVEVGFLTNEAEAKNLVDNAYLQKLSLGIYNGLAAFVTHFERSRGFTDTK